MGQPEESGDSGSGAPPALPAEAANPHRPVPTADACLPLPVSPLEISSEALLGGRTEVRIRHRGEIYRLTLTRTGKLILHK
jgi:hemin uptake protein HemP